MRGAKLDVGYLCGAMRSGGAIHGGKKWSRLSIMGILYEASICRTQQSGVMRIADGNRIRAA
jgi:hypothetical protein